jgi:hypothetical protein
MNQIQRDIRYLVPAAGTMKIDLLWDVAPFGLEGSYQTTRLPISQDRNLQYNVTYLQNPNHC